MNLSRFFIDRPRFAIVISLLTMIVGALSYVGLPVAQFPDVAPPTVVVSASYPGADAVTIAETVATPIEQEVNGVEDMLYMTSQSTSDGTMQLTVTFGTDTDLDRAQVLVQNRVAIAESRLPEEVTRLGVTTTKSTPDLLIVVHLVSPDDSRDQLYISNYALLQVRDVLARIEGVGNIQFFGSREYSMRVWLDADRMSAFGLSTQDIVESLRRQNVQVAAGAIGQPPAPLGEAFQLSVNTQGRFEDPEQFGGVIIRSGEDGRLLRVRDVARVELGARNYTTNSYLDGQPAVAMAIQQRPGANAIDTVEEIYATMDRLAEDFPDGLAYRVIYNPTAFIERSVDAVIHTLFEAVVLVIIVIVVFLQSWRAAIIPLAAIPVSLIGTFAIMAPLGFSLNNLSLFGLVLAIGIVVDDAIVVVENVERNIEDGLAPKEATRKAMGEVSGAIVAMSLVLVAVFVPTAFLSGITGAFYRQFALTIAGATMLSMINSLTLSPALCALLLQPRGEARKGLISRVGGFLLGWFFKLFNKAFDASSNVYAVVVRRIVRFAVIAAVLYVALLGLTGYMFNKVPAGFVPEQDQGYLIVAIQLPEGASLERTDRVVREVSDIAMATPGIENAVAFAGFSGATRTNASNAAAVFTPLAPFEERQKDGLTSFDIIPDLQERLSAVRDASIIVLNPPAIRGIGTGSGFRMQLQDRSGLGYPLLQAATDDLVDAARDHQDLEGVFSTFRADTPQLYADIDRTKTEMLGVPVSNVFETLSVYLGSAYINDFTLLGRTYRVTTQGDAGFRLTADDILSLRTTNAEGGMVPLGSVVTIDRTIGPSRVMRHNLYPAASIDGRATAGTSSGEALAIMDRLADQTLPRGMSYEWSDLAFQQQLAGNTAIYIFPLAVLFVFLLLTAQYESWSLPLIIILIVPMCLLCAIAGVWLRGMDNNILTQIGLVVLVALATKNAILIVEFAKQQEDAGKNRFDAVVEACRLRLRPILMTAFAFILGVVPLLIATGPASEMRRALGTAVFSGMLGVTLFGLFLTPAFYVLVRRLVGAK
ncbi:MAG: multidrug efflux RND transporter permease subunit [Planctomycetota bacterium]